MPGLHLIIHLCVYCVAWFDVLRARGCVRARASISFNQTNSPNKLWMFIQLRVSNVWQFCCYLSFCCWLCGEAQMQWHLEANVWKRSKFWLNHFENLETQLSGHRIKPLKHKLTKSNSCHQFFIVP